MHTTKKQGELFVQDPVDGPFNNKALQWRSRTAYIPYHRVKDFISGEESRTGFPTKFVQWQKHENVPGSLKRRVDEETYLEKICYHCSYGPDLGTGRKRGDIKEEVLDGDEREAPQGAFAVRDKEGDTDSEAKKRGSKNLGCLCNFEVRRLYLHPSVARLTYECFEHINLAGVLCHGTMDSTPLTTPRSATSPGEREVREQKSDPDQGAVPAPGVSIHFEKYEEILRIESRLKMMLYNHPSLLIDYCSLLEDLEGKLNNVLANKGSPLPVLSPVNNPVSGFGLKVQEAVTKYPSLPSFQYPPAPPVRFPSVRPTVDWPEVPAAEICSRSMPAPVVDWPKLLAGKISSGSIPASAVDWPNVLAGKISSGSIPPLVVDWPKVLAGKISSGSIPAPAPPLGNGSEPGCDWKRILGGRPNPASIYVPPAPPMRDNPGGFDWEKALAEGQSSSSRQHLPSTSGQNRSPGFGSTLKQVVGRSKGSTIYEIPPIPPFKPRSSMPTDTQDLEYSLHGLASKRHKILMPVKIEGEHISSPLMQHNALSRPAAFSREKTSNVRTLSDLKDIRDSSEDTSST